MKQTNKKYIYPSEPFAITIAGQFDALTLCCICMLTHEFILMSLPPVQYTRVLISHPFLLIHNFSDRQWETWLPPSHPFTYLFNPSICVKQFQNSPTRVLCVQVFQSLSLEFPIKTVFQRSIWHFLSSLPPSSEVLSYNTVRVTCTIRIPPSGPSAS